jgi:aspartate/methionine/tyrosine aminotransferase
MYSEKNAQTRKQPFRNKRTFRIRQSYGGKSRRKKTFLIFSLGNPNVPAPECVKDALYDLADCEDSTIIHGYTSAQGDAEVRKAVSDYINERFARRYDAPTLFI